MYSPLRLSAIAGASWITRLVGILGVILIFQIVVQEIIAMRSGPRASFIVVATAFARHGMAAASVDLGWYPPNATVINNLTHVLETTGVYGFVYNNSYPTDVLYGTYNWCNMPHVRKQEYKKPSGEYKLKYVEIVRSLYDKEIVPVLSQAKLQDRFTDITSAPFTLQTHFPWNHMAGTVMMKVYFSMDGHPPATSQLIPTGMVMYHRRILSSRRASLAAVSSLRLLLEVSMTLGSMGRTCMAFTTICCTFCQMISPKLCHFVSLRIKSQVKWLVCS